MIGMQELIRIEQETTDDESSCSADRVGIDLDAATTANGGRLRWVPRSAPRSNGRNPVSDRGTRSVLPNRIYTRMYSPYLQERIPSPPSIAATSRQSQPGSSISSKSPKIQS